MKTDQKSPKLSTLLILAAVLTGVATSHALEPITVPDGFASQNGGTTGGGDKSPTVVSTAAAFKSAIAGDDPAVIVVKGRLDVGSVSIGSNKTIAGDGVSSGLFGGTIKIGGKNCIIQNLTLGPASGDVMEVSGATNILITKCDFSGSSDELCSIVRGSDFVTVSWSRFHFPDPDSHSFPHLIGNSDKRTSDRGKLHVTMHHNYYGPGCRSRMPRVRFGKVHVYNNYYHCKSNNYCIGTGVESKIRVEASIFDGINRPWNDMGGMKTGAKIGWKDLQFIDTKQPTYAPNSWPVFEIPYKFKADELDKLVKLVMDPKFGAGNRLSR